MDRPKSFVKLQQGKLNVEEIVQSVVSPCCGAISVFIGTTRDSFEGKKVVRLEYEAYESMALKEMQEICDTVHCVFDIKYIIIYHRLGVVPVSEASVVIAASSPHRVQPIKAVEHAITLLKSTVPIWKKEIYDTGESQWKENKECPWSSIKKGNWKEMFDQVFPNVIPVNTRLYNQEACNKCIHLRSEEEVPRASSDSSTVQIRASNEELESRIRACMTRKRQQANILNLQEFFNWRDQDEEKEDSCARVDARLIRRKDSKSHVKVHKVMNSWGPQTTPFNFDGKASIDTTKDRCVLENSALEERLSNAEKFVHICKPVSPDIYQRLKDIEDRLLHLEGISLEYKDLWVTADNIGSNNSYKPIRKRTYTANELERRLHDLENKYANKMK